METVSTDDHGRGGRLSRIADEALLALMRSYEFSPYAYDRISRQQLDWDYSRGNAIFGRVLGMASSILTKRNGVG